MPSGYLLGQNSNITQTSSPDSTDFVIRRVSFKGNDQISNSTLYGLIQTHTNREFLGIPGFTPWYFIYKLTKSFGEKPALLNYQTVGSDLERITQYYHSTGFLKTSADSSIAIKNGKARVTFNIKEGKRSYIRSIAYSGIPDSAFENSLQKIDFYKNSDITEQEINDSTYTADLPYLESKLNTERDRIITMLKNHGYAAVKRDSISALVKHHAENKQLLDVLYLVKPGHKYRFGDISISLAGPGADTLFNYQQHDTLSSPPFTFHNQKIYMRKEKSAQSHFSLLTDQLLMKPGATFNYNQYIRTVNQFQNLGMLSVRRFGLTPVDSVGSANNYHIPTHFMLQTLPKNSINFDLYGLQRYGYGSGAGITFTNNNVFGRGENLDLSVNGSFEYVGHKKLGGLPPAFTDSTSISTNNKIFRSFESKIDFSLPRLTFPFAWLDDSYFFSNARTHYSLTYNRSDQLLFKINSKLTFQQRYVVKHNNRFTSYLDLLELELLDTNPSPQFEKALNEQLGDTPLALEQIKEDFRPQFSSVIRYTFRSDRTDLIERNYGYYSEYSVAVGGNLAYLLDRFVVTPGTVEGQLPSPVRFSQNTLDYSRFVKGTADYRRYFSLAPNTVFAVRGFGGYAYPYGVNRTIPLDERFYAGGSNDIRGWSPFGLGPGGLSLNQVTINGGEIKLLGQAEYRQTVLKDFFSSNWILAAFTDAGNVWYGPNISILNLQSDIGDGSNTNPSINFEQGKFNFNRFYKQIAVGSGVGIRLDFNYLIARFDFAFRLHDLQKGWFNNRQLYFHFGIGQSF